MKLFAHWPEGSEMSALVNLDAAVDGRRRIGFHLRRLYVVVAFRYPHGTVSPHELRQRFSFRVAYWPYGAFALGPNLYFDYQRQSLIVGDWGIPLEHLELLARNHGKKVNR